MQRLEVSGAVRPIYGSLGVKRLRVREIGVLIRILERRRENAIEELRNFRNEV